MHGVDRMNDSRVGQYYDRTEKNVFAPHLPPVPAQILDIGGSTGRWTKWLDGMGHQTTLADYDFGALKLARQRGLMRSVYADGQQLPLPAQSFDAVFGVQLVGSLPNRSLFFTEVQRVLKPAGLFFLSWSNRHSLKGMLYHRYSDLRRTPPAERLNFYRHTHREHHKALESAGFHILAMRGYAWQLLPRSHDTVLVNIAVGLESTLRLHKLIRWSPNVIIVAQKN